jgi:integrase
MRLANAKKRGNACNFNAPGNQQQVVPGSISIELSLKNHNNSRFDYLRFLSIAVVLRGFRRRLCHGCVTRAAARGSDRFRVSRAPQTTENRTMSKRTQLLDSDAIADAPDGVLSEPGNLDGCALEIKKCTQRSGSKSLRGYFRYPGRLTGEKSRTVRVPLGPYDQGLRELRRKRGVCEQLIERHRSPKRHYAKELEKQCAGRMTVRQALDEFFEVARETLWKSWRTRALNERVKRLHLEPENWLMDMAIEDVRGIPHLRKLLGPKWNSQSGNSAKMRSLLHGAFQYQMDKEDAVYHGPNPASWRKTSPLSRHLGEQLESTHHPGPAVEDIPHIVAHLRTRHDGVPGYLSTMAAAYAYDRPHKTIATLKDLGRFSGVLKLPQAGTPDVNYIPIPELHRVLGEFVRAPAPMTRQDLWLYDRLVQFLIFTPIRAGNACGELLSLRERKLWPDHDPLFGGLRWRNIVEDEYGQKLIEFLPRRKDPVTGKELPSEHKLGWKYNVPYLVIRTENLDAIIEEQRQRQIRHGVEIKRDGLVFVHGPSRIGFNRWEGKHFNHRAVEDHLQAAADHLFALGKIKTKKKITPHGLRTTFVTWAKKHGYSDDCINLSLGHTIPAIRENKTNWAYFYEVKLIEERREMMIHWERHCLSLCKPALVSVPASA